MSGAIILLMSRFGRQTIPFVRVLGAALLVLVVTSTLAVDAAAGANAGALARTDDPAGSPGVDFPVLPKRCYDPYRPAPTFKCSIVKAGRDRPTVVLWGDSHAWQYLPAVQGEAKARRLNLVLFMAGGCPPTLRKVRENRQFPGCDNANRAAYEYVMGLRDQGREVKVLLGSFWAYYRLGYRDLQRGDRDDAYHRHLFRLQHKGTRPLFKALSAARVPFDIIGQSASIPDDAPTCQAGELPYQCALPRHVAMPHEKNTRRWLDRLARISPGRHLYINTSRAYCNSSKCRARVGGNNVYYDAYHLGAGFAATLGSHFTRSLDRVSPLA